MLSINEIDKKINKYKLKIKKIIKKLNYIYNLNLNFIIYFPNYLVKYMWDISKFALRV